MKIGRTAGGVEREAKLLPVLGRMGLAVPAVLAEPVMHPDWPYAGPMMLLSELPGRTLPFVKATLDELDLTCRLLQEAVARMRQLTEALQQGPESVDLPRVTLADELQGIIRRGGPWMAVPPFAEAVERLRPLLERMDDPLVFSNGDYNTFNFLTDGTRLTGWLDFTGACFEDPHIGFAKFVIWGFDSGWQAGVKAGLVERYLYAQNVSRSAFAPRLALHSLWRLQREVSVTGPQDARYRQPVLNILQDALDHLP